MIYIVTGVSRGLGKAIAEYYLAKGEEVIGVGRSHEIDHDLFSFRTCDFSEANSAVDLFDGHIFNGPVTLINNAGILGDLDRYADLSDDVLHEVLTVNTIAPMQLAKKVYNQMANKSEFTLVNISSGAGSRPITSWASYCASKAALNMLSETFYLEEKERGNDIVVYSVAPGVIDTRLQDQIRSTSPNKFSGVDRFISLKEDDNLYSPEEAAMRFGKLLELEFEGEIMQDLRMLNP